MRLLNDWFAISKKILTDNKIKLTQDQSLQRELCLTLVFTDSDSLFPRGDIANLGMRPWRHCEHPELGPGQSDWRPEPDHLDDPASVRYP